MATEVKFGDWIGKGFELYKQNIGVLILATLVALVLSSVTLGILAGPMMAGLCLLALDLADGKGRPDIGRIFNGFQRFVPAFLFVLMLAVVFGIVSVLGRIPLIGQAISLAAALVIPALVLFAMWLIADRGRGCWEATQESVAAVLPQFWPLLGFSIVTSILGSVGVVLCGVGLIVTWPMALCAWAVAYRAFFPAPAAGAETALPTAPAAPPPPQA